MIEYNGKRPNKFWYAAVKAAAMLTSFTDKNARQDGLQFLKHAGISLGVLALGFYVVAPLVAAVPLAPIVVTLASSAVAFHFAIHKAWPALRKVYDSGYCNYFVDKAEQAWLKRQKRPSLFSRAKETFQRQEKASVPKAPFKIGGVFDDRTVDKSFNSAAPKPNNQNGQTPRAIVPPNDFKI